MLKREADRRALGLQGSPPSVFQRPRKGRSGDWQHRHDHGARQKCRIGPPKGSHERTAGEKLPRTWELATAGFKLEEWCGLKLFVSRYDPHSDSECSQSKGGLVLIKCLRKEAKKMNAEPRCSFNCCVIPSRLLNFFASHFLQFSIKLEL